MDTDWLKNVLIPGRVKFLDGTWTSKVPGMQHDYRSFAEEWKTHSLTRQLRTWDLTASERFEHFLTETKTPRELLPGKLVLDAGCGNGQLTDRIGAAGAKVVGIDMQPLLPTAGTAAVFVQGDFVYPPFFERSFDIVIANGSIHHTRDTSQAFMSLASLVKGNGKLYVWVYKKQKGTRLFMVWCLDFIRFFVSRFGPVLQKASVKMIAWFFYMLSRVRKGENAKRTKDEIVINVYDAFTPRYRHYHTVDEVMSWFHSCGFPEPVVTHATNEKYGFGVLGIKESDVSA